MKCILFEILHIITMHITKKCEKSQKFVKID